jgi:non-ribosomal peptide synthetase-like protein
MGNSEICAESAQISYVEKEAFKINQISKSIYIDDIYHGEVDLSLIRDECLFEIFENAADIYPSRPAVIFNNKEYSYEEIDSNANRLARYLREKGIQTGDKVGLILGKSVELYIAMLGIMKAGAAYVPIDAYYPPDRVKYILENSEVSLTITSSSIASFFGLRDGTLLLDHEHDIIDKFLAQRLKRTETGVTPNDLSYIIYTSGSTGRPKGVQLEHKSVCNLVRASQKIYQIKPEDRVYQGFTVAFDASVEEIWMAFGHGAALVPQTPEMQKAGPNLGRLLNDAKVTVLSCVPTLLSMMLEDIPSLRLIVFGGEVCPHHLIEKWSKPARRLMNTYGPTEATVIATYSELERGKKVTIGRPLSNYSVYIMNEDCSFAPYGEAGELVIGGIGLARGYIGREDLNKEKFIETPEPKFHKFKRFYKTGDLARFNEDGEIEFLGRIDSQVKIRGFRVELSEIESVINLAKGVRASVVAVHDSPEGIQKLAAYIVPKGRKEAVDLAGVSKLLKERLPNYMIPQYLEFIDEIPVLPSGKADRKNLPLPNESTRIPKSGSEVKPRTDLEIKIAEVWKSVFKIDSISIKDHFFDDLGGHSLFAALSVSALRKYPEMASLNFSDIYENPTVEKLVKKIASHKHKPSNVARNRKNKFLPSSTIKHALCGIGQAMSIYLFWALLSIPFLVTFYILFSDTLQNIEKIKYIAAIALIFAVVLFPLFFFVPIATKWVIIGRYKPGRYPLWGSYYFRWWFVGLIQSLAPSTIFSGTPLMPIYLRLMGTKVGTDCYIGTTNIQTYDLISIGDKTSIGLDTQVLGYTVEDGYLVLGRVEIGSECYVGTHSVLSPGSKMEDGSMLLEQSMLSEGATIPSGESWAGSPASISKADNDILAMKASFKAASLKRKLGFVIAHISSMYLFGLIFGFAALPVLFGMYLLYLKYDLWVIAFSPIAATLSILLISAEIIVVKKIVLGRVKPGTYGIYSAYYFRKSLVDQLMHMSLAVLHTVYATLYILPFLKALGVTTGRRAEVSTVTHFSPDLLYIGDESFFADASMAGTPKIYMNQTMIAETRIGKRTFVGNSALVPINTTIGDNCLIGVLSLPPNEKITASGTSWLGTPAMYLHKRDINTSFSETQTYSPTKLLYAKRLTIEFFRVIIPTTLYYFGFVALLLTLVYMEAYLYLWQSVLILPFVVLGFEVGATLTVVLIKLMLVGTYKPNVQPLWSPFVWKTELLTGLYETICVPILLLFRGTPFIAWFLRLLGCKIGKRVYIGTTFISEFDLVKIEDEAAINFNSTMQTHLFEDRVMKMSHLIIGKSCTVGNEAIVLYDTVMEEGSKLGNLSLLMKGETLPAWTSWEGNPAKLNDETAVLSKVVMEKGSKLESHLPIKKGERMPLLTSWKGNLAKLNDETVIPYKLVMEESSKLENILPLTKGEELPSWGLMMQKEEK